MKTRLRIISFLCIMCLVISSCHLGNNNNNNPKQKQEQMDKDNSQQEKLNKTENDNNNSKEGKDTKENNENNSKKILLDQIVNKGVYTGFTDKQKEMLEKNGFLITEPNFDEQYYLKMHQAYEHLDYSYGSVFITTDSVLNMWHVFYSESMKALELSVYLPKLRQLSIEMEKEAKQEYANAPDALDGAYAKILAYFHVANILLTDEASLASSITGDSMDYVKEEMANIEKQSIADSRLFNRRLDYSQFKVRGHYTKSPELTRYFKAMMWYGFTGFDLEKDDVTAVLIAHLAQKNQKIKTLWQEIYDLTSLYSGKSDDILTTQMQALLKEFDSNLHQELANIKGLEKLKMEIQKLPLPKIVPALSEENKDFQAKKIFKFMGQRFSVDAYIMQNLMKPILRPISTVFDVFTVMGAKTAEKYLRENYTTNQDWKEYDQILEKLTQEYASGALNSENNFYNGWIRSIDHSLNYVPKGKTVPYFMTTPAYEYKKINTALGSFAELKHDNILYSKQAMAEMGGPEEKGTLHYLEPNVDLYQELLELSKNAEQMLTEKGVDKDIIRPLTHIKEILQIFVQVSKKELNGEEITTEELQELKYFGGLVDQLYISYLHTLIGQGYDVETIKTSALIADIATVLPNKYSPGGYQEIAIGIPYEIYTLCSVNGVSFLAKGVVYSAFEFFSEERLTDEEWQEKLGLKLKEEESNSYLEANFDQYDTIRKLHMPYFKEFSTGEKSKIIHDHDVEVKEWLKQ